MSKWNKFKHAIANPKPESIYEMNMQQNILSACGTIIVCAILIYQGKMWWLSLAFVFSLIGNYTNYIVNRIQRDTVRATMALINPKKSIFEEIESETSIFEKRYKTSKKVFGLFAFMFRWLIIFAVVIWPSKIIFIQTHWIARSLWGIYLLFFGTLAYIYSFKLIYILSLPFYNKQLKRYKEKG
jgi:hypothetical protein